MNPNLVSKTSDKYNQNSNPFQTSDKKNPFITNNQTKNTNIPIFGNNKNNPLPVNIFLNSGNKNFWIGKKVEVSEYEDYDWFSILNIRKMHT